MLLCSADGFFASVRPVWWPFLDICRPLEEKNLKFPSPKYLEKTLFVGINIYNFTKFILYTVYPYFFEYIYYYFKDLIEEIVKIC